MRNLFVFVLFFSLFSSCKKATQFQAEAYVRYLYYEKQLNAEVKIADSKSPKVTCKVEDLFFNDGAMERQENKIQGIIYKAEKNVDFPTSLSFSFKNEKTSYNAVCQSNEILNISAKDSLAHKRNGITLSWQGKPLSKDELLTIIISDEDEVTAETKVKGATEKNQVAIPGAMFSGLKNGKGKVQVVKTYNSTINAENLVLDATVDIYCIPIDVKIQE